MKKPRFGIIINNIGTPNSYHTHDVATYLKEFLMDKDIIGAPFPIRYLLVHGWIAPFRSPKSAINYQKIWTENGSPLMVHTLNLKNQLQQRLGDDFVIEIGMRYGLPSIAESYEKLLQQQLEKIFFLPLYPQFAEATTGSANRKMNQVIESTHRRLLNENPQFKIPQIEFVQEFFSQNFFLKPYQDLIQNNLLKIPNWQDCHFVFSYHGLPKKKLNQIYADQCLQTTNLLVNDLNLKSEQVSTTFQSRLGPIEWLQPYTEPTIAKLAQNGVRRIVVLCPSFVADCIETLEEIGIGCQEVFHENGGKDFYLLPCLNSENSWSQALSDHFQHQTSSNHQDH